MTNAQSYRARLSQSKETRDAKQLDYTVRDSGVRLLKEVLDSESRVGNAEAKLDALKNSASLNFAAIIEAEVNYEAEVEVFNRLVTLQLELFPENVKSPEFNAPVAKSSTKTAAKKATPAKKAGK